MHTSKFFPLALVLATVPFGCQSRTFSQQKAAIGIPTGIAVTYTQTSSGGLEFTFQSKNKAGAPVNVTRNAKGSPYSNIQFYKDSGLSTTWGTILDKNPSENYGFVSNSPWTCAEAELLVFNEVRSVDASEKDQLCIVAMHTTGRSGEGSVVLIGSDQKVGSSGKLTTAVVEAVVKGYIQKIDADLAAKSPGVTYAAVKANLNKEAASNVVELKSVKDGTILEPNVGIDPNELADAIFSVYEKFNSSSNNDPTRQTCYNNFRTAESNWTDASTHYWCQFPVDARGVYVEELVRLRDETQAKLPPGLVPPLLARADSARKFHKGAYAKSLADGLTEFKWIEEDAARKNTFFAIMTTVLTVGDFNIDLEQQGINAFYSKAAKPRPRRINDTFPGWLLEQPRYVQYRLGQSNNRANWANLTQEAKDFAAKIAAGSAGSGTTPAP